MLSSNNILALLCVNNYYLFQVNKRYYQDKVLSLSSYLVDTYLVKIVIDLET